MMATRKSKAKSSFVKTPSDRSFIELIRLVPYKSFVSMVSKSGLPSYEARDLCRAFKEMGES